MKARELRERTLEELKQTARDMREDLFNLKFQRATGQLDNVARLKTAKRNLARVETILREHQLGIRRVATAVRQAPAEAKKE